MQFVGIIGDQGSGKTAYLTAEGRDAYYKGHKIISNYKLADIDYALMPFTEIAKLGTKIYNSVILMDELGRGADSYDFFDTNPRKISLLVQELRKRGCILLYTVQRFHWIARRLRDITEGFVLCEDMDAGTHGPMDGRCKGLSKLTYCDSDLRVTDIQRFNHRYFWDKYNTREMIWGYEIPSEETSHKRGSESALTVRLEY